MKMSYTFYAVLIALMMLTGVTSWAATANVEGTPAPTPPKPDFSSMNYLIGTWECSDLSSRRPGPFSTTKVYSMDPSGYWMVRDDTVHKASWISREFHSQTKVTYDTRGQRWVRITTSDTGTFAVATAPMTTGSQRTFTYVIQTKTPDIASYAPEVYTKVSDTKRTMTTSFTENDGRVVTVKETCTKS